MNNNQISAFKYEMNYYRFYKESISKLKEEIELKYYDLSGVKAIQYDKSSGSVDKEQIEQKRLSMLEDIEKLEKEKTKKENKLNWIDKVLNQMADIDRELFLMKYEKGLSYEAIGRRVYISKTGVFYRMDKALREVNLQ